MCLQHVLSGYFQTYFGNFQSHFRAKSFWDIDQKGNSDRKTNGSLRLIKFQKVQSTAHMQKSELNLFSESVRFQSFSAQFQFLKCSRFFVCVTASLTTIFTLQGWKTKLTGPCLGPPWGACSWPPRPALTLRAKPGHRLPHPATAGQTMTMTSSVAGTPHPEYLMTHTLHQCR